MYAAPSVTAQAPPTNAPTKAPTTGSPTTSAPTTKQPTPAHCDNKVKDADESDVDCGGSDCFGCANSQTCVQASDCDSNLCVGGSCEATLAPSGSPTESPTTAAPTKEPTTTPIVLPTYGKHVAHGALMLVAFGFLFPMGAMFPMYLRGRDNWFELHRGVQLLAGVLALVAFIIIISAKDESANHFSNAHERLGLAVLLAAGVQIVLGFVRPHAPSADAPPSQGRRKWSAAHHAIGVFTLILGCTNTILGADRLQGFNPSAADAINYFAIAMCVLTVIAIAGRFSVLFTSKDASVPSWKSPLRVERANELVPSKDVGAL